MLTKHKYVVLALAMVPGMSMALSPAGKTMIAKGSVNAYEVEEEQRKLKMLRRK